MLRLRQPIAAGAVFGVVVLSVCASLSACGLDVVEARNDSTEASPVDAQTQPDSGTSSTAILQSADGGEGGDASSTPPRCSTTGTACSSALADGWSPVALASAQASACPSGYTARDVLKASAADDACTCIAAPSLQDPPSCDKDDSYGGGVSYVIAACLDTGAKMKIDGPGCAPVAGSTWISGKFSPIVHLGTCVPSCTPKVAKLTKTALRLCEPAADCREEACVGASDGKNADGLHLCLAHDGDVACPGDAGFSDREVVANDATLSCEGATCTNDVSCEDARLHFFNDGACSGNESGAINADGKCNSFDQGPKGIKYTATKKLRPSKMAEPAKPTVNFTGKTTTICCRSSTSN